MKIGALLTALTAYFEARAAAEKNKPLTLLIQTQNELFKLEKQIQHYEENSSSNADPRLALLWSQYRDKKRLYEALLSTNSKLGIRPHHQNQRRPLHPPN